MYNLPIGSKPYETISQDLNQVPAEKQEIQDASKGQEVEESLEEAKNSVIKSADIEAKEIGSADIIAKQEQHLREVRSKIEQRELIQQLDAMSLDASATGQVKKSSSEIEPLESVHVALAKAPRPLGTNKMDGHVIQQWIDAHDPLLKQAVSVLIHTIQHVGQEEFEQSFEDTLEDFRALMHSDFTYVAATEEGKSNGWMADIAEEKLKQPITRISCASALDPKDKNYPNNIVLFDDGIYSGEQISRIIRGMIAGIKDQPSEFRFPRFIIACPYITKFGEKVLSDLTKEHKGLEILILHHKQIPTVVEAVKEYCSHSPLGIGIDPQKVLERLHQAYWPQETAAPKIKNQVARLKMEESRSPQNLPEKPVSNKKGPNSRGVVYFDHKVPDECSFPKAIAQGNIVDPVGITKGNLNLIPKTYSPYKNS